MSSPSAKRLKLSSTENASPGLASLSYTSHSPGGERPNEECEHGQVVDGRISVDAASSKADDQDQSTSLIATTETEAGDVTSKKASAQAQQQEPMKNRRRFSASSSLLEEGADNPPLSADSILPLSMRVMSPFLFFSQGCCVNCAWNGAPFAAKPNLMMLNATSTSTVGIASNGNFEEKVKNKQNDEPEENGTSKTRSLLGKESNIEDNHQNGNLLHSCSPKGSEQMIRNRNGRRTTELSNMEQLFQSYYSACTLYNCKPNPGVLAALRYSLPALRVSGSFHDADMLALSEVLLANSNSLLKHVERLDFSRASVEGKLNGVKGFKSHGAFALSRVLLNSNYISEVFLQRHKIGPYGAAAIFAACQENPVVKVLILRRCLVGERGAYAFAQCVASDRCCLLEVDLSNCCIGYLGSKVICGALIERERRGLDPIDVDLEGNLIFQEVRVMCRILLATGPFRIARKMIRRFEAYCCWIFH